MRAEAPNRASDRPVLMCHSALARARFGPVVSVALLRPTARIEPLPCGVPSFYFETDDAEPCPIELGGPGDVLVYFLSLAFSTRYGSLHPLSQLALLLRGELKIDLVPLTTFADRDVEVEADQVELDRVWQDAAPLLATLEGVTTALASSDDRIALLTADAPDLAARLADLQRMVAWAAARSARVRMTFEL